MSPRTGRPKTDNPMNERITIRLDKETLKKLDEVAKANSETRVQTIRRGIEALHSDLKKK